MVTQLNLKEIERKAFRSTYQDGLWDMYYGFIVVFMSIFIYRPADGYSPTNIVLAILGISLAYCFFWAGKKYITLPRMGQVRFGPVRKQKKTTLAIILGVVVLIQIGIVGLTTMAWVNPVVGSTINNFLNARDLMSIAVAAIGSLMVGISMTLIAYFSDFPRGFYIAIMMSLAVFLMISLNQPVYPIVVGTLIILPGLILFVRFLNRYPLPREVVSHE
jgi:hypothetical protein